MADTLEGMDDDTIRGLALLSKKLAENPGTRRDFQKLIKKQNPSLPIPEVDLEVSAEKMLQPLRDEIKALKEDKIRHTGEENIRAKRTALREKGYTAAEVDSIEKLMVEKQIPSHDTAAEFYKMQQTSAQPGPPSITRQMQMPVKGDAVKAAGGIRKWAQAEAYAAADDIRNGRIRLQ